MRSIRRLALLLVAVGLAAAGGYTVAAARQASGQAVRTALAQAVDPTGAHGRTLGLSRVVIPPHTALALHRHPGTQVAYIEHGTLSYTVKHGSVPVYSGAADQRPRLVRRITGGHSGTVHAGEWVIERPSAIHFGANKGDGRLVILLATLFTTGSPPSIPVTG